MIGLPLATVTVTGVDVVRLPPPSRARAAIVCAPLIVPVVFHAIVHGAALTSAPTADPSRRNCTPATNPLSDAVAASVTPPPATMALAAGAVRETMGGTLSTLKTVTVTGADVARLPDESRAVAVTVC